MSSLQKRWCSKTLLQPEDFDLCVKNNESDKYFEPSIRSEWWIENISDRSVGIFAYKYSPSSHTELELQEWWQAVVELFELDQQAIIER